ncbi:hypothetical protein FQN57_002640 [Myotisia sp. PD_48]|nr:hypothetical protein FQN57_002640 [Myotisia sp. PD_48]
MSLCRHAYRKAAQHYPKPSVEPVWISDELLQSTFTTFVQRQRRYGSSVPGPLEAGRRLAKRKNMDLASSGGPQSPFDMGIVFGLPSFMKRSTIEPGSSSLYPSNQPPEIHDQLFDMPGAAQVPNIALDLTRLMDRASSLDDVRQFIRHHSINLNEQPSFSRILFDRLLSSNLASNTWKVSDTHEFLADPALNPFHSGNFVALVDYLVSLPSDQDILDKHITCIKRAFSLGMIPADDIGKILLQLPHIKLPNGPLELLNAHDLALYYKDLWDGLASCAVSKPSDVGASVLSAWLDILLRIEPSRNSIATSELIAATLISLGQLNGHQIPELVLTRLDFTITNPSSPSEPYWPLQKSLYISLSATNKILREVPPDSAVSTILKITDLLASSSRYIERRAQRLEFWAWILLRLIKMNPVLFSGAWDLPSSSSQPEMTKEGRQYFLRLWILKLLGTRRRGYVNSNQRRRDLFESYISAIDRIPIAGDESQSDHSLAILQQLGDEFRNSGLPYTHTVFTAVARIKCRRQLGVGSSDLATITPAALELFHDYEKFQLSGLINTPIFKYMVNSIDITEPMFVEQILAYTESGALNRGTLISLLQRHTPLQLALAKARRGRTKEPGENVAKYNADGMLILDPHACLDLINSMALIFACSENDSYLKTWKLTHWCYKFLVAHNAPVSPILVRAMYYAGVRRYKDAGKNVPSQRYKFILRLVAEVEGPGVADVVGCKLPVAYSES